MTTKRWLLIPAALCVGAAGCHSDTLYLKVNSPADVNAGRPVRMLVRAVDQQDYVNETYQAVADKVVVKDESVLASAVVYPRLPVSAAIKKPSKGVSVYFFFTTPGPRWKTVLELPLPDIVDIRLAGNSIESVKQH
jgi:hypothetical protein